MVFFQGYKHEAKPSDFTTPRAKSAFLTNHLIIFEIYLMHFKRYKRMNMFKGYFLTFKFRYTLYIVETCLGPGCLHVELT